MLGVFFADRACVAYLTAAAVIDRTPPHSIASWSWNRIERPGSL